MATNNVQTSGLFNYTNSTGSSIASGSVVVIGHTIGIALTTIANGSSGTVDCRPGMVYTVPKVTAAVFVQGEKLIYDVSASKFDDSAATPATGDITGGVVAFKAGAADETTCEVMLTPGNATKT